MNTSIKTLKLQNIKVNKIQCQLCQDIVESTSRHSFKWCKCKSCAVDGGHDYLRRLGNISKFTELSEFEDE